MISTNPVESFGDLAERFPGIDQLDPIALGRFAFHAAVHTPSDELRFHETDEAYQAWHNEIGHILNEVDGWRSLMGSSNATTRLELAMGIVRERQTEKDIADLNTTLQGLPADEGSALMWGYLEKGGYAVRTSMSPSPLFPKGRVTNAPLDEIVEKGTGVLSIPHTSVLVARDGRELDRRLEEYLKELHPQLVARERIELALNNLGEIDTAELAQLRAQYGSKAAALLCFEKKLSALKGTLETINHSIEVNIPPFIVVATDMFEAWLNDPALFMELCETTRAQALNLQTRKAQSGLARLVVVRSSAVKSEDGEEHSGAGVYTSVAVDPRDNAAFQQAVEAVYKSTHSEAALSYQRRIGVTDELMGLVIQEYQEEIKGGFAEKVFYGHANSRGANPNLLELHMDQGTLLYDRLAVENTLFYQRRVGQNREELLHSAPEHGSGLYKAAGKTADVPHAVLLAERLFKRPMQVEFVNGSIVQVRPLQISSPEQVIEFPTDLEPTVDCAAAGFGDMELEKLDEREDNSDRIGFVVFWQEYEFTINDNHAGYDAFPKEGAVVIFNPSSSGHIQAICREKGLMCFYPQKGASIDHFDEVIFDYNGKVGRKPKQISLRFVADGYKGKIYKITDSRL